jgi:hypothetical protein
MDNEAALKWLKTALLAAAGGGIAAAVTAAFDPQKYNIAHDLGSGKMWIYFFQGFAVTFGALLLKSPLGQKVMTTYKDSQAQLKESQASIEATKAELKDATKPCDPSPPKP